MQSLLSTSTNQMPHERMFSHPRRSARSGASLPSWLSTPGKLFMKRHVKSSKYDNDVEEVELLEADPQYAHVRLGNGRESTVSLRLLAPTNKAHTSVDMIGNDTDNVHVERVIEDIPDVEINDSIHESIVSGFDTCTDNLTEQVISKSTENDIVPLQRSSRIQQQPDELNL